MERYRTTFPAAAILFSLIAAILLLLASSAPAPAEANPETAVGRNQTNRAAFQPDKIIFREEPSVEEALIQLEDGEMHIYGQGVKDPAILAQITASANLDGYYNHGSYNELTFNPYGPIFSTGKLNPFAVPRIREAMNYLVDRDHIAQEILAGLATPRWLPINTVSNDYADLADVSLALEIQYTYNPTRAQQIIGHQMTALGATLVGGVWFYNGAPVEIILLIRTEDARQDIGDYLGDQLESIGFTVIRDYRQAWEASPIWLQGNPADGLFHIYTGGWITTIVPRDLAGNFAFFYTNMGLTFPLWQAYVNTPQFYALAQQLDNAEFASLAQRRQMMSQALVWAMQDSMRIWLVDVMTITPRHTQVSYASDLYGGFNGSRLWPHTIEHASLGGDPLVIGLPFFLIDPWNPLSGSQGYYDTTIYRATADFGTVPDPYTGLAWPQRIASATVVAEEGLLLNRTLPWVELQFAPSIIVPNDAWVDWDATTQQFLTAAQVHSEPQTARIKSVVTYPANLNSAVLWHDGSPFSPADVVLNMILTFDRAKEASAIYDSAAVSSYNSFQANFKGVRIVSTNPLVIEHYTDNYELDAERNVHTWWPYYATGPGAWHNLALGIMAETAGQAAFGGLKAYDLEIEHLNYIGGNSLTILNNQLSAAQTANYIPYAPTLGQYITSAAATQRWNNMASWYGTQGHFWLGSGPYYLKEITIDPKEAILERFLDYADPPDRWSDFTQPQIPEVTVSGPPSITRGEEAIYNIEIGFDGQPYTAGAIESVSYLIISEDGDVAFRGQAVPVSGPMAQTGATMWRATLSRGVTVMLPEGQNELEVIVVSNRVVIAGYGAQPFTAPAGWPYRLYLPTAAR